MGARGKYPTAEKGSVPKVINLKKGKQPASGPPPKKLKVEAPAVNKEVRKLVKEEAKETGLNKWRKNLMPRRKNLSLR